MDHYLRNYVDMPSSVLSMQCLINALKIGDTGKAQIDTIFPGYVNRISYDAKQYQWQVKLKSEV